MLPHEFPFFVKNEYLWQPVEAAGQDIFECPLAVPVHGEGPLFVMGDLSHYRLDWLLLGTVTALAIAGIFVGNRLSRNIDGNKLKKAFGWFVLAMGIYILIKELYLNPAAMAH